MGILLDGELFTDAFYYENLMGLVKKKNKTPEEEEMTSKIKLLVFDYIEPSLTFEQRISNLNFFFKNNNFQYLKLLKTEKCFNEKEVMNCLEKYSKEGFEGLMIRNIQGKYEPNVRSVHVQKIKKYVESVFEIVGCSTPKDGKEHGCVIWKCVTPNGKFFFVKPKGSHEERRNQYMNWKSYVGRKLLVRYQYLSHDGVPRFGLGISIN